MNTMNQINSINAQLDDLQKQKQQLMDQVITATDVDTLNMPKAELIKLAMQLPEMPVHLMAVLKDCGFMTGSSVYGEPSAAADIDWCVNIPPQVFIGYALGAKKADYFDTDQFQPLYANYKGQLLNIICFSDRNLMGAWKLATDTLTTLACENSSVRKACTTKWSRVRIFRALCDIFEPVRDLYTLLDKDESIKYSRCMRCGREAINFTNKAAKDRYLETGICERHN